MGVRSHIGVQNVHKILFGADKGRSNKTCRSLIRGSLVTGTTVMLRHVPALSGWGHCNESFVSVRDYIKQFKTTNTN